MSKTCVHSEHVVGLSVHLSNFDLSAHIDMKFSVDLNGPTRMIPIHFGGLLNPLHTTLFTLNIP